MTQTSAQKTLLSPRTCPGCLAAQGFSCVGEKDAYTFWRCGACKTVITDPLPTQEDLAKIYTGYSQTPDYLRKKDKKMRRSRRRVRRLLRARPPGKRFLDIGCSVGYMVAAAHEAGLEAYGVDIDKDTVEFAKQHFSGQGTFEAVPHDELVRRGAQFDIVYTADVVEHIPDPDAFVATAAKLVAPDGLLYIAVPDGDHFATPRNFAQWGMVVPPDHLTYFSRKGMRSLLARHGFDVEFFQFTFKPDIRVLGRKKG